MVEPKYCIMRSSHHGVVIPNTGPVPPQSPRPGYADQLARNPFERPLIHADRDQLGKIVGCISRKAMVHRGGIDVSTAGRVQV